MNRQSKKACRFRFVFFCFVFFCFLKKRKQTIDNKTDYDSKYNNRNGQLPETLMLIGGSKNIFNRIPL